MDFTEPLFYVISVLSTVLVGILGVLYRKFAARYDWLDEIASDEVVNDYIVKGVMYVKSTLTDLAEEYGKEVEMNSPESIQQIVQYVLNNAPKALKKTGFTEDYLTKLVKSYLTDQ